MRSLPLGAALAAACLCAGVGGAGAHEQYRNPTAGRELAYQIPGMHLARVKRNVTYRRLGHLRLKLDVYRPRRVSPSRRLPVVLLGGPPNYSAGKDSGQKIGWAQLIAASGMAAVAFDTRFDSYMRTPRAPAVDVAHAIAYVRNRAADLGIDASRVCTLGFSFGTAPWHLWATMRQPAPYLRCNVVYYGPLDLEDVADQFSLSPNTVEEFSAITYLRRHGSQIPPMLIAKAGQEENEGINASIERFVAEATQRGADVRLVIHETGYHGFDIRNRNSRTRAIIRQTLAYFRARLLQN